MPLQENSGAHELDGPLTTSSSGAGLFRNVHGDRQRSLVSLLSYPIRYLSEHWVQIATFGFVGVVTFGINFGFFHLFYGLCDWNYRIAISLAYLITIVSHFLLHRLFTFSATDQQISANVAKYLFMLAVNYGVTLAAMEIVVEFAGLSPYFGVVASAFGTASTSFFMMKYFVFKERG